MANNKENNSESLKMSIDDLRLKFPIKEPIITYFKSLGNLIIPKVDFFFPAKSCFDYNFLLDILQHKKKERSLFKYINLLKNSSHI